MNAHGPTQKLLYTIWLVLLALLVATWGVAQLNFGQWAIVVAMTIAVVKMVLVILFFMHVRYSSHFTWVLAVAGFFWLFIMIALTMGDYLTRSDAVFR